MNNEANSPSTDLDAEKTDCPDLDHPIDPERFERLMLRVASLKKINPSIIEEVFFRDVIGNVRIDSIVPSIIGSEATSETMPSSVQVKSAPVDDE